MAEKISVQIALEGGAEIERQLADIGEAGKKAFAEIERSATQVGGFKNLKPEEVTEKLKTMGLEGTEAFSKIQKAVQTAVRWETAVQGVQSMETALAALGRAAGPVGVAIAAAFAAMSKATIAFAGELNKASDAAVKLGLSLEQFKTAQADFAKLGVSQQAASEGLKAMAKAAEQVRLDAATKAFKELQEGATRGFGAIGTSQLKTLEAIAQGYDKAGASARQYIATLGLPISSNIPKTLAELETSTGSSKAGMAAFLAQLRQMPDGLNRTNLAIGSLGETAGTQVVQGMRAAEGSMTAAERKAYDLSQAFEHLKETWNDFGSVTLAPAITAGLNFLSSQIVGIGRGIETTVREFAALGNVINTVATAGAGVIAALAAPIELVMSKTDELISLFRSITWDVFANAATAAWNQVIGVIQNAINKVKEFLGLKPQAAAPAIGGGGDGFAGGGLTGGRGTGTSDSNLAWVSRGEHIMPARAVRQPGVLAFLEALRRSGGNLSRVLDGMGRFALGGMVPRSMPAFAAGGLAGGMSNVTIQFPGLPAIGGLRASSAVVDELRKAAALAQVRSGGRKPSRYS